MYNTKAMNYLFLTALLAVLPSGTEWQDNQALSFGKEPTRAAFSSFETEESALKILPEHSERTVSLDSDTAWRFNWAKDPASRPVDFYKTSYDVSAWPVIKVPCSWQAMGANGQAGWGTALYTNVPYPFRKDVPGGSQVMLEPPKHFTNYAARNPVGSYRRDFTLPEGWLAQGDVFLKFDGVDSFFYLWVNGEYVGFSKDSRSPAEFNVTKYLAAGKNTVALEVYRYSDGSYLEDQDMFRLSGIFRRTWLLSRPKERITDLRVTTKPVVFDQFDGDWEVKVDVKGHRASGGKTQVSIYTFDDRLVYRGTKATFVMPKPKLWSAEDPNCYKLVLSNGKEFVSTLFGFRVSEMRVEPSGVTRYYLNGQKIKLKGANRHETDPLYGHFVPMWRHEQDVRQLKAANCNCVRNAHYPQDDYWYYLCDVNGIYLVDEANVESHGYGYGDQSLSHQPSWEKATVDRNVSMVKRNFNHPSVVIWSLGNEAGPGENFRAANAAIKALDPVRPIHYERDWTVADMDGCQYPAVPWTWNKAAQAGSKKPFYISEYAHNMGNAMGNLKDYQDAIESSDVILGATIWDWVDQGLWMDKNGKRILAFGGDFGDKPNDGFFVMNGCVLSDRELEPGYWEIKHVYQNWTARATDDLKKIVIRNKNYFVDSTGVACTWTVLRNGEPYAAGEFALDGLKPQAEQSYALPAAASMALSKSGLISLRVKFLKGKREIASDQIELNPKAARETLANLRVARIAAPQLAEDEKTRTFTFPGGAISFCKQTGLPCSIKEKGLFSTTELLKKPMTLDVYRAPSANESSFAINIADQWAAWGLMDPVGAVVELTDVETIGGESSFSVITEWTFPKGRQVRGFNNAEISVADAAPTRQISFKSAITWTVGGNGTVRAKAKVRAYGPRLELPRVGFSFVMDGADRTVRWFGRGPWENYADRKSGAFLGKWTAKVADFFVPYCRNETSGDREETFGFSVDSLAIRTLGAPFAFSVNPYEPIELLTYVHPPELPASSKTVVGVYAATRGLGGASCGPAPIERDLIRTDRDYDLDFTLQLESESPLTPRTACEIALPELPERTQRTGAKIVTCSSREPGEGDPEHLLDGDIGTIWHSQYGVTMGNFPHAVVVELAKPETIKGLRITQRQVGVNGRVKDFTLETSLDGQTWSKPLKGALQNVTPAQDVLLPAPTEIKFYRFTALNNHYGDDYASLAEIEVLK